MSSADFSKTLVVDDRIANLTDSLDYVVIKGGANITSASYTAQSATNSSHTYSVQVPSEQTVTWKRGDVVFYHPVQNYRDTW